MSKIENKLLLDTKDNIAFLRKIRKHGYKYAGPFFGVLLLLKFYDDLGDNYKLSSEI